MINKIRGPFHGLWVGLLVILGQAALAQDDDGGASLYQQHMVVREAATELVTISPVFETVTETIVIEEAYVELEMVPPTYETVTELIVLREAEVQSYSTPNGPAVRIQPAITKKVTRRVVKTPAMTIERKVPAKTKDIEVRRVKTPARTQERVIPAITVPVLAAPFQAQIVTSFGSGTNVPWDRQHVCGGALISDNWVLSAAHCFRGENYVADKFGVRLYTNNISDQTIPIRGVKRIIPNPNYINSPFGNDIALIELEPSNEGFDVMSDPRLQLSHARDPISNAYAVMGGERLVTLGHDHTAKLWDAATMQELARKENVVIDPNAPRNLYAKTETGLQGINLDSFAPGIGFEHGPGFLDWKVSDEHQRVLSWSANKIRVWDKNTGGFLAEIPTQNVRNAFIVNQDRVLIFDGTTTVLWNVATRKALMRYALAPTQSPLILASGRSHLMPLRSGVMICDSETAENCHSFKPGGEYVETIISDDEKWLLVKDDQEELHIWNLKTRSKLKTPKYGDGKKIGVSRLSQSGQNILILPSYGSPIIWNMKKGKIETTLEDIPANARGWKLFDKGKRIFVTWKRGESWVLNVKDGKRVKIDHSVPIDHSEVTKDEAHIVSVSEIGTADIWDANSGIDKLRVYHGKGVKGAKLFDNNRALLTWGVLGDVRLWDVPLRAREDDPRKTIARSRTQINHMSDQRQSSGQFAASDDAQRRNAAIINIEQKDDQPSSGQAVLVFGWGKIRQIKDKQLKDKRYEPSKSLRMASLTTWDKDTCLGKLNPENRHYERNRKNLSKALDKHLLFCAGEKERKTCYGDSGGPLVRFNKLVGIVSIGGAECVTTDGKPGYYTRVGAHEDWIKSEMSKPRAD